MDGRCLPQLPGCLSRIADSPGYANCQHCDSLKNSTCATDSTDMIGNLSQIEQLGELLRQSQIRHEVISGNIANVNTPGYQSREVVFSDVLSDAQRNSSAGINSGSHQNRNSVNLQAGAEVIETAGLVDRMDGNNVDIDQQLAKLTDNALNYQTYSQLISSKLGLYRAAIRGS